MANFGPKGCVWRTSSGENKTRIVAPAVLVYLCPNPTVDLEVITPKRRNEGNKQPSLISQWNTSDGRELFLLLFFTILLRAPRGAHSHWLALTWLAREVVVLCRKFALSACFCGSFPPLVDVRFAYSVGSPADWLHAHV